MKDRVFEVLREYTLEELLDMNGIDVYDFVSDLVERDLLVLPVVVCDDTSGQTDPV